MKTADTALNDPTDSGGYGASQAVALLASAGQTWSYGGILGTFSVDASFLAELGILVLAGADAAALEPAETAAVEAWVADGGGLLYSGFIPGPEQCDSVNSLPAALGVSCPNRSDGSYWTGTARDIVAHPVTVGVSAVEGVGGPIWSVSAPSSAVVSQGSDPVVTVADYGLGRFVTFTDDWITYDTYIGTADNAQLVANTWAWLGGHALE